MFLLYTKDMERTNVFIWYYFMKLIKKIFTTILLCTLCYIGYSLYKGQPVELITQLFSQETIIDNSRCPYNLVLVNNEYSVRSTPTLASIQDEGQVDEKIVEDANALLSALWNEGLQPTVTSSYRTSETQQQILNERIEMYHSQGMDLTSATEKAYQWVAKPGHSEHETGLALDINSSNPLNNANVYRYLADHAYEYGFIVRYKDAYYLDTRIKEEPWHVRYVGKKVSQIIQERNISLEQYIREYGINYE